MPMHIAVLPSTVKLLDLLYVHIISSHGSKVDIVSIPSSHLASQWYDL